jgi:DNA-binding protein HU-beta
VIKQDLVNRLVERSGVSEDMAEKAFDALLNSMKGAMARGERIELRGFGVFAVVPRKSGMGRNPRTGEAAPIPVGKTVRFKPGKELRPVEKEIH